MEGLSQSEYGKCGYCRKSKMLYVLDIDQDKNGYCWKCANMIIAKFKQIKEETDNNVSYRKEVRERHATI